jgi:hypothetical protein
MALMENSFGSTSVKWNDGAAAVLTRWSLPVNAHA